MAAEIERIVDRKTIRGRVHYLVVWRGFGEESNTWESRMDLVADGFHNVIREFESGRKGQDGDDGATRGRSKSPGRRARSRSNSTPRSPSAGRGRKAKDAESSSSSTSTAVVNGETAKKRATKKAAADKDAAALTSESSASVVATKSKSVVTSSSTTTTTSSSKGPVKRTTTHKEAKHIQVAYEKSANANGAKATKTVSAARKVVHEPLELEPMKEPSEGDAEADRERLSLRAKLVQSGALVWIASALVVVLSLVASAYVGEDDASQWRQWIPVLTPIIALLLVFRQFDTRASLKWVAIGLAWRPAAELLFVVDTADKDFHAIALGCSLVANVAFFIAVATILRQREHARSSATLFVYLLGFVAVLLSDSWILQNLAPSAHTRTTLMAVAVLTISLSPMLSAAPDDE